LVHVPVPVADELADTLQPILNAATVPPAAVVPVAIEVHPDGKAGAVAVPLRKAQTILRSPVAVALNVPLVAEAETLPSLVICAEAENEKSNAAAAASATRTELASSRTQGQ
jgi:hypothetical protein